MKAFIRDYLPDKYLEILDLGSQIVRKQPEGSYSPLFTNPKWHCLGADIVDGDNVDVVIEPYKFPFPSNSFDVVISGQTIEHMEFPWIWFKELARVLKKGGLTCIITPAVIHEHKYPIDTYRYYPDGMKALAKWSKLRVLKTKRVVVDAKMEDTYLIATK